MNPTSGLGLTFLAQIDSLYFRKPCRPVSLALPRVNPGIAALEVFNIDCRRFPDGSRMVVAAYHIVLVLVALQAACHL